MVRAAMDDDVSIDELREAVERMHGVPARFVEAVEVDERLNGEVVWQGAVKVFDLTGHSRNPRVPRAVPIIPAELAVTARRTKAHDPRAAPGSARSSATRDSPLAGDFPRDPRRPHLAWPVLSPCPILEERPMQPTDLTIEILKDIRDEIRGTNARIDDTNARVDGLREDTNARFDETNTRLARLERRQIDADMRVATLLTSVANSIDDVRVMFREDRAVRGRVDDLDRRVGALERRGG